MEINKVKSTTGWRGPPISCNWKWKGKFEKKNLTRIILVLISFLFFEIRIKMFYWIKMYFRLRAISSYWIDNWILNITSNNLQFGFGLCFCTDNWIKDSLIFWAIPLHKIILEHWKNLILKEMISITYVCMHVSLFHLYIHLSVSHHLTDLFISLFIWLFFYSVVMCSILDAKNFLFSLNHAQDLLPQTFLDLGMWLSVWFSKVFSVNKVK